MRKLSRERLSDVDKVTDAKCGNWASDLGRAPQPLLLAAAV